MPRFFIRQDQIDNDAIRIIGDDAHHIARSLRMAVGDPLTVCDMQGNEYQCCIDSFFDDKEVIVTILSAKAAENEPPCRIRLFQALPKGDKLDTIIQKAVECGASEIVPFESERCVVRMKPEAEGRKTERRQRIAEEAAKQCGRSILPKISETVSFYEMLRMISDDGPLTLFCYEGDGTELIGEVLKKNASRLDAGCDIFLIIGSEGGFSIDEAKKISEAGAISVGLGKRILRAETASAFALSCIAYATELGGNK